MSALMIRHLNYAKSLLVMNDSRAGSLVIGCSLPLGQQRGIRGIHASWICLQFEEYFNLETGSAINDT